MISDADANLIVRLQSGDDRALTEVFDRYEVGLFQFLCGMLRDHHLAEDALQETYVRALERIKDVRINLKGWLFTVAHNEAMLLKRRRRVQFSNVNEQGEAVSDIGPGPSLMAELHDDSERLRELLGCLPPAQQEVIRLRVYEGKKFREIAEMLQCPLNTVLARMHEGLKRLRSLWERSRKGVVKS